MKGKLRVKTSTGLSTFVAVSVLGWASVRRQRDVLTADTVRRLLGQVEFCCVCLFSIGASSVCGVR